MSATKNAILQNDIVYFYNGNSWLRVKTNSSWCHYVLQKFSPLKNGNCVASVTLNKLYEILKRRAPDTFNPNNVSVKDFTENVVTLDFTKMTYYRECYPWRVGNFAMSIDCSRTDIVLSFDYNELF